jgi:hypothetical protein
MASTAISSKKGQDRQQVASFNIDNGTSLDNEEALEGITTTSNISKPSVPLPLVAENLNLSSANSINLTGATTQIDSEEHQPAVIATITTTPITIASSSMVQPCCTSNGYIANAGPDQTMLEGTRITLNGSGTNNNSDNIGNMANYLWRQTDGPSIILNGNNTAHPNFIAPNYPNDTKYTFALEVFDKNQANNNNQKGSVMDSVDILVTDANAKSKKGGSFQKEVFASNYKSESLTESFMKAPTNGDDDDKEEEEKNGDKSDKSRAAMTTNQYDQVEEIEKVKEKEKPDTESVIEDEVKKDSDGKEDDEEEEMQKSHDDSEPTTEESEPQIEKVKEKEKTEEEDDGTGSNSDSNIIHNHITSFSSNNNNDYKENNVFNYDIKIKKFTDKMKQNVENLKDRLENSLN